MKALITNGTISLLGLTLLLNIAYGKERDSLNKVRIKQGTIGGIAGMSSWLYICCKDGKVGLSQPHLEGQLAPKEIKELKKLFKKNKFFSLKEEYKPSQMIISDSMTIIITYIENDKTKTVLVRAGGCAPKEFWNINSKLDEIRRNLWKNATTGELRKNTTKTLKKWPFQNEIQNLQKDNITEEMHKYFTENYYDLASRGIKDINELSQFEKESFNSLFQKKPVYFYLENGNIYSVIPTTSFNSYKNGKVDWLNITKINEHGYFDVKKWPISEVVLSKLSKTGLYFQGETYLKIRKILGWDSYVYYFEEELRDGITLYMLYLSSEIEGELSTDFCNCK